MCRMVNSSEKLQVPTLLIWAANDTALGPQLALQTPQFVEDLELHILDDCSHWAQQDRYAARHTVTCMLYMCMLLGIL